MFICFFKLNPSVSWDKNFAKEETEVRSFINYLLSIYYLPGIFLGIGDTGVNRRDCLPSKLTTQGLRIVVLTHMRWRWDLEAARVPRTIYHTSRGPSCPNLFWTIWSSSTNIQDRLFFTLSRYHLAWSGPSQWWAPQARALPRGVYTDQINIHANILVQTLLSAMNKTYCATWMIHGGLLPVGEEIRQGLSEQGSCRLRAKG